MENDKQNKIIIGDKEFEIIAYVNLDIGNFIVYTDQSKDENGNIQVFASIYDPENPNSKLEAITTDREWKVIETILETLQEEIKKKQEQPNDEQ